MKKLIMLVSACSLFVSTISDAKVKTVQSRRDFEQSVAKDSMVVALFYDEKDKGLTQMYEDVSKVQKYDDADVIFLKVNTARPELNKLTQLYNVPTMPACIFFHRGQRLYDTKGGAPAELFGNISRGMLQSSIDKLFGAEIAQYIAQKNTNNAQRLKRENESWKPYYYPRDIFVNSYGPDERNLE